MGKRDGAREGDGPAGSCGDDSRAAVVDGALHEQCAGAGLSTWALGGGSLRTAVTRISTGSQQGVVDARGRGLRDPDHAPEILDVTLRLTGPEDLRGDLAVRVEDGRVVPAAELLADLRE